MKKYILLIIAIFAVATLTGCANNADASIENNIEEVKISVKTIDYDAVPWDDPIGDFTHKLTITPEMAVKLSELYLTEINPDVLEENKSVSVRIIEENDICVINYAHYPPILGGDISIAINLKSGEVLKMWAGE